MWNMNEAKPQDWKTDCRNPGSTQMHVLSHCNYVALILLVYVMLSYCFLCVLQIVCISQHSVYFCEVLKPACLCNNIVLNQKQSWRNVLDKEKICLIWHSVLNLKIEYIAQCCSIKDVKVCTENYSKTSRSQASKARKWVNLKCTWNPHP